MEISKLFSFLDGSGFVSFLTTQLPAIAATWLITYLVQSTILIGVVWLICRSQRMKSNMLQEALWKVARLAAIVTTTVSVALGGASLFGHFNLTPAMNVAVQPSQPSAALTMLDTAGSGNVINGAIGLSSTAALHPADTMPLAGLLPYWPQFILLLWVAGVLVVGARLALRRDKLDTYLANRHKVANEQIESMLLDLQAAGEVKANVLLTSSLTLTSPVALTRSEICLPERAIAELDPQLQQTMLAHELAHIVRRDPQWLTAYSLLDVILFFQPLNKLAERRLSEVAEYLCDDWAVQQTGGNLDLARCLAEVASWIKGPSQTNAVSGMLGSGSPLSKRVQRLLDNTHANMEDKRMLSKWRIALVGLPLLVVCFTPGLSVKGMASPVTTNGTTLTAVGPITTVNVSGIPVTTSGEASSGSVMFLTNTQGQDGASIQVEISGDITFTDDHKDVKTLTTDGSLTISEAGTTPVRKIVITAGADGTIQHAYSEDGVTKPYDAAAQQWLAGILSNINVAKPGVALPVGGLPALPDMPGGTETISGSSEAGSALHFEGQKVTPQGNSQVAGDIAGDITYTDDYKDIKSISAGGSLGIQETLAGTTKKLVVTPNADGTLQRVYTVNGTEQTYDAAAATWFAGLLTDMVPHNVTMPSGPGAPGTAPSTKDLPQNAPKF